MVSIFLALGLAGASAASTYQPPRTGNIERREFVCMMQDMVMAREGIPMTRDGKTYWGCCEMCKQRLEDEPERFLTAVDPVTGKAVDKSEAFIYALEGSAFYFESRKSRAAFARAPARYLKKR